ncbi:hypothetical protein CR513_31809, partial [Mucuna pruriens]
MYLTVTILGGEKGSMSVEDYYKEIEIAMTKANVEDYYKEIEIEPTKPKIICVTLEVTVCLLDDQDQDPRHQKS